jgi:hypothetical protein
MQWEVTPFILDDGPKIIAVATPHPSPTQQVRTLLLRWTQRRLHLCDSKPCNVRHHTNTECVLGIIGRRRSRLSDESASVENSDFHSRPPQGRFVSASGCVASQNESIWTQRAFRLSKPILVGVTDMLIRTHSPRRTGVPHVGFHGTSAKRLHRCTGSRSLARG